MYCHLLPALISIPALVFFSSSSGGKVLQLPMPDCVLSVSIDSWLSQGEHPPCAPFTPVVYRSLYFARCWVRKQRGEGCDNCTLAAATGLIFVQVVKRDIDGESLLDKWVASGADGTGANESYCFHMDPMRACSPARIVSFSMVFLH